MITRIAQMSALICSWGLAPMVAADITPYVRYLEPILVAEVDKAPDRWLASGAGGYLVRCRLDLDGDGTDEVFVTCSLNTYRLSAAWTVLRMQPDGRYEPIAGEIRTALGGLCYNRSARNSTIIRWYGDNVQHLADKYTLVGEKIVVRENENITTADYDRYEEEFRKGLIICGGDAIETILIADFVKNPEGPWKSVRVSELKTDWYSGGFIVAGDEERISKLVAFTPANALEELRRMGRSPTSFQVSVPKE